MPKAKSPDKPLRQYWSNWTEQVGAKLDEVLTNEQKKKGLPFKNLSQAAKFAASELTRAFPEKKEPFSASTLTRNDFYRRILDSHVEQKNKGAVTSTERVKLQLKIRNQEKEISDLKNIITNSLEDRSHSEKRLSQSVTHDATERAVEDSFRVWLRVLDKLLKAIEGASIDTHKRTVEDPEGLGTLLTEKDFPKGFFNWMKRNNR